MGEKTEIQKLSEELEEKWGVDSKTKNLSKKIGDFLVQLGNDTETSELLKKLLKSYNYYSKKTIEDILLKFNTIIVDEFKLDEDKTLYSVITNDSKMNSSNNLLEIYKWIIDIPNSYSHTFDKLSCDEVLGLNIVFFDDIIGSGTTIKKFFNNEENKKRLLLTKNYIFCIEILEHTKINLTKFFEENKIDCQIISHNIQKKTFKNEDIFKQSEQAKNKSLMKKLEKKVLNNKKKLYILGYKDSQALVSFFRNTPNNTMASFWTLDDHWNGLFCRNNKAPAVLESNRENIKINLAKEKNEK